MVRVWVLMGGWNESGRNGIGRIKKRIYRNDRLGGGSGSGQGLGVLGVLEAASDWGRGKVVYK